MIPTPPTARYRRHAHGPCRHCREHRTLVGRGLCGVCNSFPGVRDLYDPLHLTPPPEPAAAPPRPVPAPSAARSTPPAPRRNGATTRGRYHICARRPPRVAACHGCGKVKTIKGWGLCSVCWRKPEVREGARSGSARPLAGRRGVRDFYGAGKRPEEPTAARPGTAEKIAVLAARAARGEGLWHERDGVIDG